MQCVPKNQRGKLMKKIIVCMCLVLFIGTAYGQGVFVFKYYYNYEKGWTGGSSNSLSM